MSKRSFEMYQYRQVLVRLRQGDSDRDIARDRLMGRKKVGLVRAVALQRGWLDSSQPLPEDEVLAPVFAGGRPAITCVSTLEPLRQTIAQWVNAGLQGTTIHAALQRNHGFGGSYSSVRRMVSKLAPKTVQATSRMDFLPAEAAQVDFGRGPDFVDVHTGKLVKSWFFVMTLAWSRHQYAEFVSDQTVETWLGCHRRAFEWFGGVPERSIIDNPKCAITRAAITDPTVQRAYAECAEGYGFKISPCAPRDPKKKGIVESGVKYIKRAFVPLREFRSIADANRQLWQWLLEVAGQRIHGTTREAPLTRFAAEKSLLKALPVVAPEIARWAKLSVHRDAHVSFERALYSVPARLIGQQIWLRAGINTVQCFAEHELVATHVRLSAGQRATVRDHLPPNALAFALADPEYCLAQAGIIGPHCLAVVEHLFADRVLDHLRAAQGVIRLQKRFGSKRLEAACQRAIDFADPRYRTVKTILDKGLDQSPSTDLIDTAAEVYSRGGRYCRDTASLLKH